MVSSFPTHFASGTPASLFPRAP
uniref:Uncharacterized protein n=1 Tax=Anguilla anguilla TaxID=7936 RepID=A0A0E9XCM5_ANGAN